MTMLTSLATHAGRLLHKRNVVGVGIGYKVRRGRRGRQLCLTVLVERKLSLAALAQGDIVPTYIDSYPTDVVASGSLRALAGVAAPGASIGHYRITAGTFGAVVYDNSSTAPLILSNNHVLANSSNGRDRRAQIGDPILCPGPIDGGRLPESLLANLTRFQPLTYLPLTSTNLAAPSFTLEASLKETPETNQITNLVDAAVAKPLANATISASILGIGPVIGTREAELDLPLIKSGRTTGVTSGIVLLLNAVIRVSFGEAGTAIFSDQIISDIPSAPGDSGSLVLDREGKAVGLLFAGGEGLTVCNRIAQVERSLAVQMLPF